MGDQNHLEILKKERKVIFWIPNPPVTTSWIWWDPRTPLCPAPVLPAHVFNLHLTTLLCGFAGTESLLDGFRAPQPVFTSVYDGM